MKPFKIETIHAFIVTDNDGVEGIPAFSGAGGMMFPMLAGDPARLESMRMMADLMTKQIGKKFTLAQFSVRTDLEVIG